MSDICDCLKSAPSTQSTEQLLSKHSICVVGTVLLRFALTGSWRFPANEKAFWILDHTRQMLFFFSRLFTPYSKLISYVETRRSWRNRKLQSKQTNRWIADAYVTKRAHPSLWHFPAPGRSPLCSQVDWAAPQPSASPLPQTANWNNNKKIALDLNFSSATLNILEIQLYQSTHAAVANDTWLRSCVPNISHELPQCDLRAV